MHVCFLFHREYPQNYSTAMNEYTKKLVECGVDVTVIAGRTDPAEPSYEVLDGVDVYRIDTDVSTSVSIEPTRFGYRALHRLDDICCEDNIDILHMIAFPNVGAIIRTVPWLKSPPVTVMDVRGTAVRNQLFDAISRVGLRLQRHLVEHTIVIDRKVATNVFNDTHDLSILPIGVDLDRFTEGTNPEQRAIWGFDESAIVVGYIGSLHSPRRLSRLIEVFDSVLETHPNARLVVVGDGNDRRNLMKTARKHDINDTVVFTGEISFTAIPSYLRAFDIGFSYIPDRPQYRDQPPLKTAEFLAAGLPVLATDTPGNRIFIRDKENGHLIADSTDEYVSALNNLIESSEARQQIAVAARDSVKEFDYQNIVEKKLLPLYEQLVRERTACRS